MRLLFSCVLLLILLLAAVIVGNWGILLEQQILLPIPFVEQQISNAHFFSISLGSLSISFLLYIFFLQTASMLERKKYLTELRQQKQRIEQTEQSDLKQLINSQHSNHQELLAQQQQQYIEFTEQLKQLDTAIAVSIESLEDRLTNLDHFTKVEVEQ